VDGTKVREFRITLGTKERQLAESFATSARLSSIDQDRIIQTLYDPSKIIEIAYSIAVILELFGIETGLPTPVDTVEYFNEKNLKAASQALQDLGGPGKFNLQDGLNLFFRSVTGNLNPEDVNFGEGS
jgi:hypothetical protein